MLEIIAFIYIYGGWVVIGIIFLYAISKTSIPEKARAWERRHFKVKYKRPYGEWRLPVMIILVSSIVFVLITSMFGVRIDIRTGETLYRMEPNGMMGKEVDPWLPNPMEQYPEWIFIPMVLGYYACVGGFVCMWFDYCRWKWERIPIAERVEEKIVRVKVPDNWRYIIEQRAKL